MKVLSRRGGFSLIELLTVIAIIAILAAIIFPVMSTVKDKARQSECMSNMHQIALAATLFKQDNRKYPEILSTQVCTADPDNPIWDGTSGATLLPFESAKNGEGLFPEYTKSSTKVFHCATSKISNTKDVVKNTIAVGFKPDGTPITKTLYFYAYDTYTSFVTKAAPDEINCNVGVYSAPTSFEQHYVICWAKDATSVPYNVDPESADNPSINQADYERQLRFRNPPGDTVLTWCSNHETRNGGSYSGNVLIVFLDGHTENRAANVVETSKWRTRPKK